MTDDIQTRITIDAITEHIRATARKSGIDPQRDDMLALRGILEGIFSGQRWWEAPGEIQRVESELTDYKPVAPYRVFIEQDEIPVDFPDYAFAKNLARARSGARRVAVLIRDAKGVVTWTIKLTDSPLEA
jgi:hypothetical protein